MQESKQILNRVREIMLPSEREKLVARDFSTRFSTVKQELADMGCEISFSSGIERISANAPFITTVHLTAPKDKEEEIIELITNAGIKLPDQREWRKALREADGMLVELGLVTADNLTIQRANEAHFIVYEGKGWQGEDYKRVEIERP